MSRPHPALVELAAGRVIPAVENDQELVRSAKEHLMHGLLWTAVKRDDLKVSRATERELAAEFLRTKARHQRFWAAHEEISARLGAEGIESAAIKGVASEARWYDEMGERPCRDVDIWLNPDQLDRFAEAVELLCPDHPLLTQVQELIDGGYLQGLNFRLESGVSLDLHADLFKSGLPSRDPHAVWERTEWLDLSAQDQIRVLDTESALAQFLFHLNIDRFSRLGRLADVSHLIQRQNIDWLGLDQIAAKEHLAVPILLSLSVVRDLLNLPIHVGRPIGIRASVWKKIWPESSRVRGIEADRWRLRQQWLPFLSNGRLLEAFASLAKRALPPEHFLSYLYPGTRGPYPWKVVVSRARYQRDWRRRWT